MKKMWMILPILFLSIVGCGKAEKKETMQIAFDPSWSQLGLVDQQPWVTGYMRELLEDVAKNAHISFKLLEQNQMLLLPGLKEEKYDGIITTLMPTNFREAEMDFSDSFLATGPVLVVRADSKYTSVKDLVRKEIGIVNNQTGIYVAEKSPKAYILSYTSEAAALNDLVDKNVEGVVLDRIHALGYVQNIYLGKLKIVGAPITDEGLRIVALKEDEKELISIFNRGWNKLQTENKAYLDLLKKWKLLDASGEVSK